MGGALKRTTHPNFARCGAMNVEDILTRGSMELPHGKFVCTEDNQCSNLASEHKIRGLDACGFSFCQAQFLSMLRSCAWV